MSDKNPYYSIPKALGEPREEIEMLPPISPDVSIFAEFNEQIQRRILEAFGASRPAPRTALAFRGGKFVTLQIDGTGNVIEPPPRCPHCGPIMLCWKHACT